MDFYKMTDAERQILINQYEILNQGNNNYQKHIDYLKSGNIYLFVRLLDSFPTIISKEDSKLAMDILSLHYILLTEGEKHQIPVDDLLFDFNHDSLYCNFIEDVINSNEFPNYKFKVLNSHGSKKIEHHKKQIKYFK